jgi:ATP-binding cassette, subfamily C, bacterial
MKPSALGAYLQDIARVMPGRLGLAIVLLLLAAFTEGVGLLLLVPLLDLVGLELGVGAVGALGEWLARAMHTAGLTPTLEVVLALYVIVIVLSALLLRSANLVAAAVAHGYAAHLRSVLQEVIARADWLFHTRV